MNIEEKILKGILELIKEKPMLMSEIEDKLGLSVADVIDVGALPFLRKYKLAEITPTNEGGLVKITEKGLHLLDLPNLPEDETPPQNLLELMEKHYHRKIDVDLKTLYTTTQHAETADWITDMAIRYGVKANDVIRAMWLCARSEVWAKLERDLKAKHRFFAITPPLVSDENEASKQ